MYSSPIVPAIIPTSEAELVGFARTLSGLPELHVDVVDGKFVKSVSWPYREGGEPKGLYNVLDPFSLEVDLMVEEPLLAAQAWLAAGADQLVFHIETISASALRAFSEATTVTIGVSANNDTPNETLAMYIDVADYVQVMGIATIGSQGEPFDERALTRLIWLRDNYPRLARSIDGSMNADTLPSVLALEVDRVIVGSAVVKAADPRQAYHDLTALTRSSTGEA